MIIGCVFVFVMCSFFVFWIWAPLGMAPEIEERASVPCHGQRIPLRIPKSINFHPRAALDLLTPSAYHRRTRPHNACCSNMLKFVKCTRSPCKHILLVACFPYSLLCRGTLKIKSLEGGRRINFWTPGIEQAVGER